ncbi:hypothetical protein OPV22_019154 [Ensete ventricosum]|uniref:Uncharacterized protein n=1 Tax=Ensete ventricosum TaxID=4639 RepID=A0AAV8QS05_ENSVE|nr:hypothetical protein OPV22_019154 [Ensete ventricosum]
MLRRCMMNAWFEEWERFRGRDRIQRHTRGSKQDDRLRSPLRPKRHAAGALVALGTPGALVTVAGEGGNAIIYEELAHAGAALSSDAGCDGFAAGFVADAGSARIQRAARRQFRSGRSSSASSSIDHDNEQQSEDEAQSESSRIRHEKPISCLQTAASGDDDAIIGVKS